MADLPIQTVAVFDADDDTVEMLTALLSHNGYRAVAAPVNHLTSGELFSGFVRKHHPSAIIWDIAPPYAQNWNVFQRIQALGELESCPVVLTTTDGQQLDALAAKATRPVEIIRKPYHLQLIVEAVSRAIDRLPRRPEPVAWTTR